MKKFFTLIAVAAMAFAAQANTLTVGDGTNYFNAAPICGLYADTYGTMAQTIYSADMLSEMAGGKITGVTFYTTADYMLSHDYETAAEDFINFDGAKFELSFLEVTEEGYVADAPVAVEGATAVATLVPVRGDYMVEFVLDEPFEYAGQNLLVQVAVIEEGTWGQTYFLGEAADYVCSFYDVDGEQGALEFLPKTTFAYEPGQVTPPTPTQKTGAPVFNGYTTDGIHAYFVEIKESEPSTIYYRVKFGQDGEFTEWAEYEDILSYTQDGWYRIEAYAVADGKLPSDPIAYEFVVSPATGLSEMAGSKTAISTRYYNMAGQEMQQANGVTIVVTTYTDGTTSTVKVVK